jgi:hypothetical protein
MTTDVELRVWLRVLGIGGFNEKDSKKQCLLLVGRLHSLSLNDDTWLTVTWMECAEFLSELQIAGCCPKLHQMRDTMLIIYIRAILTQ